MACSWITDNKGEVIGALTEDGKKSKLFSELLQKYDVQQAQDLYEASRSDAFKEIYGEVTTLSFEDFVDSKSDFRDAHSAPSKDTTPTEDKLDSGGDFSLLEVMKGFHNQPDDYFDPQVGARYYGYNTKEGKQSFTAINNIIRAGKENQTITTYRAVPKGVNVNTLQDYDWVSFSKDYTKNHGNSRFGLKEFTIIEQEVPITDLWWDGNDINEWGYDTGNTEKLSRRDLKTMWDNMQEATPEQVVKFVTEENQNSKQLSAEQKVAVRNFGVANTESLKERLLDAFYDSEGVFFVSESKLIDSGLYSAYEASNLKNDISLQSKVKSVLEAFKNTSDVYSEDISDDQVDKINTFNSFGKLVKIKKQVEPLQSVETFQEIDGQLVAEPVDNTDLLLSYKSAEENQELEDDLSVLLAVSDEILLVNENTKTVLENVEKLAIADGLDLVGLSDKQFDRPFMQSLLNFTISPNKENTANFSQEYKRLFQKNSEVKLTGLNREVDNKDYVIVNTTLSEQEVYRQQGFIKAEDNLYIKTNSQPLEELYEVVRTYTEKYPKELTLEQYVQQETGKLQGFTNPEIAEAVVLYKMYFNITEGATEGAVEGVNNFTGNYEYLTEDFPVDFYKEMLTEKKKDSVKYNNYYVHFGIDEQGIYLNEVDSNTLENIKDFADENMKQYSVISKRIPNIADQTGQIFSTEQTRRDEAINNPNSIEKFTGEYVKTALDNVIAKNTQKEFIKVENEIYELWDEIGNLSMYTKVAQNNSQYLAVNTKKTGTREDLNSYLHLLNTPEKFINYKNNNEVEGFEC